MQRPNRAFRDGFTLVELLLVIAIIAILVSITIPALGSSRETSRRVKCMVNLKQIGTGLQAYMNDSKDLLPYVRPLHDPAGNANDPSLLDVMIAYLSIPAPERLDPNDPHSPYQHVADVLICPSDRNGTDAATNFEPVWRTDGWSYEYFAGEMMGGMRQLGVLPPVPQTAVSQLYQIPRWKDLPVILDWQDWHPLRRGAVPRNSLYYGDWHADWAGAIIKFDSQDPRLRDLVCDLGRLSSLPVPGCD